MKVLYYCPESDFYYDDDEVMTDMKERWSKFQVLQKVKELIARVKTAHEVKISEAPSSKEYSLSAIVIVKPSDSMVQSLRERIESIGSKSINQNS